ncbi:small ribosomal subunit protein bS21c [Cannabis sativa]|uniref:BZIP domain-containing protein n=1 Tax=Cannabis sativa TaxID=3483 RepID=A0A7J6FAG4_CANSA|nr:small ribosomal subunit protein bS21c [Cannabis sativa]KAF4367676.1 hypothetical protein G4B88_001428 [Cannabis sativa]KAF4397488.1 hypothetical protein G4B88_027228 [Cannabis sativa]
MAASSPLSNFFSFLLPTKPPPQPKLPPFQVPVTTSPTQSQKVRDGRVSLVAQESHSASSSLSSVICPSLAYSNTLFFKSAYNVQVVVDDNESEERLLNRFRREVMRAGVIQECKRRRYHENTQEKKKRKNREAAKRNRKRRGPPPRFLERNKTEAPTNKRDADDEDNWDLPAGDIPY